MSQNHTSERPLALSWTAPLVDVLGIFINAAYATLSSRGNPDLTLQWNGATYTLVELFNMAQTILNRSTLGPEVPLTFEEFVVYAQLKDWMGTRS